MERRSGCGIEDVGPCVRYVEIRGSNRVGISIERDKEPSGHYIKQRRFLFSISSSCQVVNSSSSSAEQHPPANNPTLLLLLLLLLLVVLVVVDHTKRQRCNI